MMIQHERMQLSKAAEEGGTGGAAAAAFLPMAVATVVHYYILGDNTMIPCGPNPSYMFLDTTLLRFGQNRAHKVTYDPVSDADTS